MQVLMRGAEYILLHLETQQNAFASEVLLVRVRSASNVTVIRPTRNLPRNLR